MKHIHVVSYQCEVDKSTLTIVAKFWKAKVLSMSSSLKQSGGLCLSADIPFIKAMFTKGHKNSEQKFTFKIDTLAPHRINEHLLQLTNIFTIGGMSYEHQSKSVVKKKNSSRITFNIQWKTPLLVYHTVTNLY